MSDNTNRRILLIDDTPSIHDDFKKILGREADDDALAGARAALFGESEPKADADAGYEIDSAYQGQEGLELLLAARGEGRPYAMAFIDIRMPPGWDGVQTIKQLWREDPELQVVICTAYSDYSWEQMIDELGRTEKLLILKKPFDSVEIRQLACAMTATWNATRRERQLIEDLRSKEAEARAYSSSLETMNQALLTAKASSERASEMKTDFLVHLSTEVGTNLSLILEGIACDADDTGVETALDSSRDLVQTLDRILDVTRLEGGGMAVQTGPTPMVELARVAVARRQEDAAGAGLTLGFRLPCPVPESVECDGARVCQVLDQLIDNALRHTEAGGVRVTLVSEPTGDWARSRLVLTVEDDGPGVPSDLQGRMFEPFVGRPGAGLGLALAHELMKLMGGELTYEPAQGGGSCFRAALEVGNLSGVRMVEG